MKSFDGLTPKRFTAESVGLCCDKVWQDEPLIAKKIASEVLVILGEAYRRYPFFFSGKSEKRLLSGLFYKLGRRHKGFKTMRVLASILETNEVTIRQSRRDWDKHFPELFDEKRKINVLLVDSDESFLLVSKECLNLQGSLNIETATSSDEALAKIETADIKPDVIVCGHLTSSTDCFGFLKLLRNKGNTTPFIVFSPDDDEELAIKAIELGADASIEKHGDPAVIYPNLKKSIELLTNT